jgi:hypothetical protein
MDRVESLTMGCWDKRLTYRELVGGHVRVNNFQNGVSE